MLVARREPLFYSGEDHAAAAAHAAAPATGILSRFTRLMTLLQLAGSLLAIPIGLASGYSIYRANFSPDATCQTLRANILATLDKGVDAATRRILVRRDVAAFENTCGAIDPDAVAAFKTLLADKPAVTEAAAVAQPKEAAHQAAPPVIATAKPPVAKSTEAAAAPVRREAASSDAVWVAAVRRALLTETPDQKAHAKMTAAASEPLSIQPAPPAAAPALPPATAVAVAPAPDSGHPVPPGSIPETKPLQSEAMAEPRAGSRLSGWIAQIPLVGRMVDGHSR